MCKSGGNSFSGRFRHAVVTIIVALTGLENCKTAIHSTTLDQSPLVKHRPSGAFQYNELSSWSPLPPGDPLAKIPVGEANQCQGVVVGIGDSSQLYWLMPAHCLVSQLTHPIEPRVRQDFQLVEPLMVHFSCLPTCPIGATVPLLHVTYWSMTDTNLAILPWPVRREEMERGGFFPVVLGRYQADVDEVLDAVQWKRGTTAEVAAERQRTTCLPGEFAAVHEVFQVQNESLMMDYPQLWRLHCDGEGVKAGTPLLSPIDGQLIALILTTRPRENEGVDCQSRGPCERLSFGLVPLSGAVYGLPLERLGSCWNEAGLFQASRRGCHLPL